MTEEVADTADGRIRNRSGRQVWQAAAAHRGGHQAIRQVPRGRRTVARYSGRRVLRASALADAARHAAADAGRIRNARSRPHLLDGEDIAQVPPDQRPVDMMFQDYALFPHMSVRGNVAFGLRVRHAGVRDRCARRRDDGAGRARGLDKRKPDQLSGGQRQRVALARSLARRRKCCCSTSRWGARPETARKTQHELKAIQRRLGPTFIIVTHDQEEAMTLADRSS